MLCVGRPGLGFLAAVRARFNSGPASGSPSESSARASAMALVALVSIRRTCTHRKVACPSMEP
eukprot:5299902-Lingulodinium_polyedra.AAC.1